MCQKIQDSATKPSRDSHGDGLRGASGVNPISAHLQRLALFCRSGLPTMCLKKVNGQACHACRQRVAVESLLTIGQSRTASCTQACVSAAAPGTPSGAGGGVALGDAASLLTPPPSEAGSLSPPQIPSDDSCDLFGPSSLSGNTVSAGVVTVAPLTRNTSRLAQVRSD